MKTLKIFGFFKILLLSSVLFLAKEAHADLVLSRPIVFPVIGSVSYYDDFGAPRGDGTRAHKGNDLMGKKMQQLVAVADGVVTDVDYPEASWGYSVTITDTDGYEYVYIHMNNDTPGTDDGKGDGANAYALDIEEGNPVVKGQLIGYMGDSGNAETTQAHLHFEMYAPGKVLMNPYASLKSAVKLTAPVINYPKLPSEMLPYDNFAGGANIASGNFDSDIDVEIVTGAKTGGGPLIKILEQNGTVVQSFFAYAQTFRGGVDVASGDVDGDGVDEIITSPGPGGGPHIRIFKPNGTEVSNFFAYGATFRGGVHVASIDIDNDKKAEIITAPMSKGGPHVRIATAQGAVKKEFFAYAQSFQGGLDVTGLIDGNNQPRVVTSPGPGGGAHIKVLSTDGITEKEWFAYDASFLGGVRVSSGPITKGSSPLVLTLPWSGGGPHLKAWDTNGDMSKDAFVGFEEWWRGGYDVAGSKDGKVFIASSAGRRTSVRTFDFNNQKLRNFDFGEKIGN